jgi:tight adherence protein C
MVQELLSGIEVRGDIAFYVAVFLSVVLGTYVIANLTGSWLDVRRRAVSGGRIAADWDRPPEVLTGARSGGLLDGLLPASEDDKTELRRFLNLAGYYGRSAPAVYQLTRIVAALGLGLVSAPSYGQLFPNHPFWVVTGASMLLAALGYYLPKSLVSLRRDKLCEQHRQGFPDFLDLLVICVEAGVGVDSAIERVGKDLNQSYPSLAQNLRFMSLELRAGRSTREALDNLAQRLGLEEARSFATLIQQSEELGSSLVQSLRVYAEEMRAKRLARAEEKAHGLPAKLVIPLGLFIFPVILGVTMMPVALKVFKALGI